MYKREDWNRYENRFQNAWFINTFAELQFVWEAFFTFSQSGGAVEISRCLWYIATVFIPSTIITAVRVSHCHACQIYFNFIPRTGAKLFPAAVCIDFHFTSRGVALRFKAQWKYWWKKYHRSICISWEAPLQDSTNFNYFADDCPK